MRIEAFASNIITTIKPIQENIELELIERDDEIEVYEEPKKDKK